VACRSVAAGVRRSGLRDASLDDDQPFEGGSTSCYVAYSDHAVIVAFRGTEVIKPGGPAPTLDAIRRVLADICTDARIRLVDAGYGGAVHCGFHGALEEVWSRLQPRLHALRQTPSTPRTIWLTGHSLGAALATLAACRLDGVHGLYTFGSPLVGDELFAGTFRASNAFRIVNNNDVVTCVPPCEPSRLLGMGRRYQHVGELKYISSDGVLRLQDSGSKWPILRDKLWGHFAHLGNVGKRLADGIVQLPDDGFNDHAPLFYALHMWNAYASAAPERPPSA
jgi:triacylglycerol lipase